METTGTPSNSGHIPAVGNAVNAERQWRPDASADTLSTLLSVGNAVNAERQWRPEVLQLAAAIHLVSGTR